MGVERTWDYLKAEFERQGDGLSDPKAKYFENIGPGPQLFAVGSSYVYYHDHKKWCRYRTAYDVVFDTIDIPNSAIVPFYLAQ